MAFGDYLTSDEWDASFYVYLKGGRSLGDAMHYTVRELLKTGYQPPGLDSSGNKFQQLNGGNAHKFVGLMFGGTGFDSLGALDTGRTFLKLHVPSLVDETDDEWAEQMREAAKKKPA